MSGGAGCGGPVDEERHARLVAEQNARYAFMVGQAAAERCEELEAQVERLERSAADWMRIAESFKGRAQRAEVKIRTVERLHVWTNEDGRRFVFADDLATALEIPGEAVAQQRAAETKEPE